MNKQGTVRNSQSATSFFLNAEKRQKLSYNHQTIVINTPSSSGNLSTPAQEKLEKPVFNSKSKEKLALKLNSLNHKKGKYKSHKSLFKNVTKKSHTTKIIYLHRTIYCKS